MTEEGSQRLPQQVLGDLAWVRCEGGWIRRGRQLFMENWCASEGLENSGVSSPPIDALERSRLKIF